jgi:hypothetical protein
LEIYVGHLSFAILWASTSSAVLTRESFRSVVLITLSDRLISLGDEKSTLGFIHDYLAARLVMLRTIEVSISA